MMKFFKDDNAKWLIVIVVVIIIIIALMSYSNTKTEIVDHMTSDYTPYRADILSSQEQVADVDQLASNVIQPPAPTMPYKVADTNTPENLLPKDSNASWSNMNPSTNVALPDLMTTASMIGINTVGQANRNANLQLRSDPLIEKQSVGPWNNSTIEADLARVPLEIGCTVGPSN